MNPSLAKKVLAGLDQSRKVINVDRYQDAFDKLINKLDSIDESLERYYSTPLKFKDVYELSLEEDKSVALDVWLLRPAISYEVENFSFLHECWYELSNRIQFVTEVYSPIFSNENQVQFSELHEKLRTLRLELRKAYSKWILDEIREVVAQIRRLATKLFLETKYQRRGFSKKLISFKRNLRCIYRQIIQFLFKNLDDESGDIDNVFALIGASQTLLMNLNGLQNVGHRQTGIYRHNKFHT